jgi:hypothetical protein
MKRLWMIFLALTLLSPTAALAVGKGSTFFGVQLASGTADLYSLNGPGYITAFDHSELSLQAQSWHFLTEDLALAISAGIGGFRETDKPGTGAPGGATDSKYTQSSFNVRIGGDHVVKLGERSMLFFGPGIEYWSGKAKFTSGISSTQNWEDQTVSRYSLGGRIGAMMRARGPFSACFQIGHKVGLASATDNGAKATWWPSSFDAAGGVVLALGGD